MKKYSLLLLAILLYSSVFAQLKQYPMVMGYGAGQNVAAGDSMKVSFNGGSGMMGKGMWSNTDFGRVLPGFMYNAVIVPTTFLEDLSVSKGYFDNFVDIKWTLASNEDVVTRFKIFRKELGSSKDSVEVANLSKDERTWRDEYTETGVMYKYYLYAEGIFGQSIKWKNYIEGIGFRVPYGVVSGRVTFATGNAVEGVEITAEADQDFTGSSVYLNGTNAFLGISPAESGDPQFKFAPDFTFQAWIKPQGTGTQSVFEKGTQYKVTYQPGSVSFTAAGQTITLSFTEKPDTFFNVTAMRTADSLKLFLVYDQKFTYKTSAKLTSNPVANSEDIYLGKSTAGEFFKGYFDEVRIWHKTFTDEEVFLGVRMYISGKEDSLTAYYRLNENVGNYFYDLTREGFDFHENHGALYNAQWAKSVPFSTQLAVKGITDENGNYVIAGIPYSSTGTNYRFVPMFDVHNFDPSEKTLYLGPGASTHSGVNFTDIAAFIVKGNVRYKDTYFPVKGVRLYIDDRLVLQPDGMPVETDDFGNYEISVPIGYHHISVGMYGHKFHLEGRFPVDEKSKWNFQEPLSGIDFVDITTVKVVGRVVGGPREAEKKIGFGKTNNNLGNGKITMTTQREYDLTSIPEGIDGIWENEMWEADSVRSKGQTRHIIKPLSPKYLEIYPDQETGEFFAYLLPEKYLITDIEAGDYVYPESFRTTLDLTNKNFKTQLIDSVKIGQGTNDFGDTIFFYRIDSVSFNHQQDFIYREIPTVDVTDKDGKPIFWETSIKANNDSIVSLVNEDGSLRTAYPIFVQHEKYKLRIAVFERYVNSDMDNTEDLVPVGDGKVEIQNYLAKNISLQTFSLNKMGYAYYNFSGGLPNIATQGSESYLQSMTVVAKTGANNAIATPWLYNGGTFKGYLIGAMPTGNNFVTTGPNEIITILRDPPGSNSYAFLEEGNTTSTTTSYSSSIGVGAGINVNAKTGTKTNIFTWATIEEIAVVAEMNVGMDVKTAYNEDGSVTKTVSNTEKWSTSPDPNYVGALGDVFIGNSTNIVYGASTNIELVPVESPKGFDFTGNAFDNNGIMYDIAKVKGFRLSPEFNTAFQYTQAHIENYLIPNLKMLRNNYLQMNSNYTCVICDPNNPEYGRKNKTGVTSPSGHTGGDSYNYLTPSGIDLSKGQFIDSVAFYNSQIAEWEYYLALNEKDKLNASVEKNVSFDAGTIYESTQIKEDESTESRSFEIQIGLHISTMLGFEYNEETGVSVAVNLDVETGFGFGSSSTEVKTTTYGYVLQDGNTADYLSVDVKTSDKYSTVFATRGGQTMCPYEGQVVTKYFQKGSVLSEATMQREKPSIRATNPNLVNVPEDESAIFEIQIANLSETNDPQWFMLSIDASSNQNGAYLSMDGADLGGGVMLLVPAGVTMTKYIFVDKLLPDVYDYKNLALVLGSACQSDPTDFQADITDTLRISASFLPVCTSVEIQNPENQWVLNTNGDTTLNVKITGYDLQQSTFNKLALQYKSTSTSNWSTEMVYYVNKDEYDAASQPKTYINGLGELEYKFDWSSMQDRNYDLKAITYCVDGTDNSSPILTGIKDVKRPMVFGTPQPADGILGLGEDVMITFDETINAGLLLPYNFSVKGVLNGNEIKHQSSVYFDGNNDYATAVKGPNLDNKSWTIEFWARRGDLTDGIIFSQNGIELGFDADNKFYLKAGRQTIVSNQNIADTEIWKHYAVTYRYDLRTFYMYINDQIERELVEQTSDFKGNGKMYMGKSAEGGAHFNGYVHEFRIWEKSLGLGTIYAQMYKTLSGSEIGLAGYWPMDEIRGEEAHDLAKARNLFFFGSEWKVYPSGYARTFDGNAHIDINTSASVVIPKEANFTIEFYFKGAPQANTVLFSNGRGDGTDIAPAKQNIWVVGFNEAGKLYVLNNGNYITADKVDVLDDKWHHFALVRNANANTNVFVDGNLVGYERSSLLGGINGATMAIGSRMQWRSAAVQYDQHFMGSMDEFRIWNLARADKQLDLDMNAKLKGNEVGLVAYYPFDVYNSLGIALEPSLTDFSGNAGDASATGGAQNNADVPNIKDARPVQNVAFNWVVNNDQIVINIDEDPALVEKCVLEFTVDRLEDMRENRIASPVSWTAYIKQNQVVWGDQYLSIRKEAYQPYSFVTEIINMGGTEQKFDLSGMPSWITATPKSGTLGPDSRMEVTFEIDPIVNIGYYDVAIAAETDFGYAEKLNLDITVFKQSPDWNVNPDNYQYSMSIIGQLLINDKISDDPNDIVAAFVNGECRGVVNNSYVKPYDNFEVYLNVYSNSPSGEKVEFRIWDASEGQILTKVLPAIVNFENNSLIGTPSDPLDIEAIDFYELHLPLSGGWNWVSFNLNSTALQSTDSLFQFVELTNNDMIKSATAFDIYSSTSKSWFGTLASKEGIGVGKTYMVKVAKGDELIYSGEKASPDTEITLKTGWNWMGYIPLTNMSLNEAFSGFTPAANDVVKSQTAFAYYDPLLGWIGSLTYLQSGVGYLYKSNADVTFMYPERSSVFKSELTNLVTNIDAWKINRNSYAANMSVVATAKGEGLNPANLVIGAFSGNECRGIIEPVLVGTEYVYYLTTYGNTADVLNFRAIDVRTGEQFVANEKLAFAENTMQGNVSKPQVLTFTKAVNLPVSTESTLSVSPNPFTSTVMFTISTLDKVEEIEIYNIAGSKIYSTDKINGNEYQWNGTDAQGSEVPAGTYFVKVRTATGLLNSKFTKM